MDGRQKLNSIAFVPSFRGILENALGGLLALALLAAAAWGVSHIDAPLPLWIVFLIAVAAALLGGWLGWAARYGDNLLGYQADLLSEAMLGLREIVAGKLSVSFEEFLERGVLEPGRFGLSAERGEEIRISIIEPTDGDTFRMIYEAGHSLGRKNNFSLPKATMAGHALETRELQWTNDVETDDRWRAHPQANEARSYGSLACMPIIVGDEPVAILNVLSSAKHAFLTSDLTYIELLGGFIGLAWVLTKAADSSHRLSELQENAVGKRKGT
jgi:GAF domain-containing protein